MSHDITINGRYVSYEVELLDEDRAKEIIEDGISDDDLEDLTFMDGGEVGIVVCQVKFKDVIVKTYSLGDVNSPAKASYFPSGWYLMKSEAGKISYQARTIDGDFDPGLLSFSEYSDSFNGHKIEYATAIYDDEGFELESISPNSSDLTIISPNGDTFSVETLEDEMSIDISENAEHLSVIDTVVRLSFKINFSETDEVWSAHTINLGNCSYDFRMFAFGSYNSEGVFRLKMLRLIDGAHKNLFEGCPSDFGSITASADSFVSVLKKHCRFSNNPDERNLIVGILEDMILRDDPACAVGATPDDALWTIGTSALETTSLSNTVKEKTILYAVREIAECEVTPFDFQNDPISQTSNLFKILKNIDAERTVATLVFR